MKKIILLLVIFIQLLTVSILLKDLYKKQVLGSISINPIDNDTVTLRKTNHLKYFYEPKAESIMKANPIFPGLENVSYTINGDTLNQLENYPEAKNNDTFRIITVGDSFTFGLNVNTEDNYPSQLNKILNEKLSCQTIKNFEVINLGVGGYDIQYVIERLKQRGIKYNPDIVIWLLISDDFNRINELLKPLHDKYLEEAHKNGEFKKQVEKGIYYGSWIKARDEVLIKLGSIDNILSLQKTYLQSLNESYNGKLLFTIFPNTDLKYKKFLEKFVKGRKNTLLYTELPQINDIDEATLPDLHPSKKGHTLISESLMHYLVDEKLIPCTFK